MAPWILPILYGGAKLIEELCKGTPSPASAPVCCECGAEEGRLYNMSCCPRRYCLGCGTSHLIESARGRLFACGCGKCTVIE
jgi:hypothetical protein